MGEVLFDVNGFTLQEDEWGYMQSSSAGGCVGDNYYATYEDERVIVVDEGDL